MSLLTKFKRLDKHLIDKGLVATPLRAQELITNGAVRVNGAVITAVHCPINEEHEIEISGIDCPWVSPEAVRLFHALDGLKIDVRGLTAIDIGTGVGGFSEVLLQKGAKKIYAVEKEVTLLHSSLSLNPRIKNIHMLNAKDLGKKHVEGNFDLLVTDIGAENFIETITPALSLTETSFDLLAFVGDKIAGKEIERSLRVDHSMMIKRVPDSLQKDGYLIWAQKKI